MPGFGSVWPPFEWWMKYAPPSPERFGEISRRRPSWENQFRVKSWPWPSGSRVEFVQPRPPPMEKKAEVF